MSDGIPPWTVGVCGFGRCGSTMVMAMLAAGGCPPVDTAAQGSYETDQRELFLRQPSGRAVKLLNHVQYFGLPTAEAWRFVWLDRDPVEQAKSMVKFLTLLGEIESGSASVDDIATSYERDRPALLGELHRSGLVVGLSYERVLGNPRRAARTLRKVWPDLDVDAAAAVVHSRNAACLPDIAVELSTLGRSR